MWSKGHILGYHFKLQSETKNEDLIFYEDGSVYVLDGWWSAKDSDQFRSSGSLYSWVISDEGHLVILGSDEEVIRDFVLLGIEGYYYLVQNQSERSVYRRSESGPGDIYEISDSVDIDIHTREGLDHALDQCDAIELSYYNSEEWDVYTLNWIESGQFSFG